MIKNLMKNANNPVDKIKKKKKRLPELQSFEISFKSCSFSSSSAVQNNKTQKKAKNQNPAPHKTMQSN